MVLTGHADPREKVKMMPYRSSTEAWHQCIGAQIYCLKLGA